MIHCVEHFAGPWVVTLDLCGPTMQKMTLMCRRTSLYLPAAQLGRWRETLSMLRSVQAGEAEMKDA